MHDKFVYAVTFLYRHFLELKLKQLVQYAPKLLNIDPQKALNKHSLSSLWEIAKKIIKTVWPDTDIKEFKIVGHCINRFMEIDPDSFSFRYPKTKKGEYSLPSTLKAIDLINLRNVIEKLSNYLDGAIDGTYDAISNIPNYGDA